MKTTLKKVQAGDKNLEFIQTAIQASLDQLGAYIAKTPSNWVSPAPPTLWDAIDRLAALAKTLNGGNPVP